MPANQRLPRQPDARQATQTEPGEPVREAVEGVDGFAKGWHDSSFELRRGLWVIETDLDPAITHGVVHRRHLGGKR